MAIGEAQESRMIAERQARNKQDKKHPYLIHVQDGRLVPNVPMLAGRKADPSKGQHARKPHPNYRVYTGDPRADLDERMKWLQTQVGSAGLGGRQISLANVEPFDVGTATLDELIEFAQAEYGIPLSKQLGLKAVRNEVIKLAQEAGKVADEPLN